MQCNILIIQGKIHDIPCLNHKTQSSNPMGFIAVIYYFFQTQFEFTIEMNDSSSFK